MGLNNLGLGLGLVFTAKDLASGAIQSLERNFTSLDRRVGLGTESIRGSFHELGVGLSVFTAGAATVGAAFSLASAAGRFEESLAAVAAVSGATTQELTQLRDAAIDAGIATQFSPTEASLGLRELAQAGFTAQESVRLLIPALDLASGSLGELTPQAAAGLAAQAMKAFALSTDEASTSVDRMLQAVNVFALSAGELPLALGTASRGAQVLHQSLSETLITLGLVKNVIPGVERASTAAAVAMERMADPKVQARLASIGVSVTDSQGSFRGFLDVVGELAPRLQEMSEAQRSAFLLAAFGNEALAGVNAILTQVTDGIRANTGETLRGARALSYLREQFDSAGGTAVRFREKMLSTFEGQKRLLKGSMETLAIVAGEPFAQVLRPLVTIVVDVVNALLGVFRQLPAPLKRAFAGFVVGAGAVVALVGTLIAAKAGIGILLIGLKVLGVTLGGLAATILPAVLVLGALAVAAWGVVVAFRNNLGGLADFVHHVNERVALAFQGLVHLFQDGGFSGAVREELARAENHGLKDFLINVFLWGHRLQNFLSALAAGFSSGLEVARPTVEAFVGALRRLGAVLGFLSARDDASMAASRFREFGAAGEQVGRALAVAFEVALGATAVLAAGVSAAVSVVSAAVRGVMAVFSGLADNVAGVVLIIDGLLGGRWADIWTGMKLVAFGTVDAIVGVVLELAGALAGVADAFSILLGKDARWQDGIRGFRDSLRTDMAEGLGVGRPSSIRPIQPGAVAGSSLSLAGTTSSMPAVAAMTPSVPASFMPAQAAPPASSSVVVHLEVDGQTLATAVHRADQDSATRTFSPVPAY
jgi:TP901 family phage tail tape measure protein